MTLDDGTRHEFTNMNEPAQSAQKKASDLVAAPDLLLLELSSGEFGPAIARVTRDLCAASDAPNSEILETLPDALFNYICDRLRPFTAPQHLATIRLAYEVATAAHAGVPREDNSPYITHPLRVTITLIDSAQITDWEVVCQALLHDVIEDSAVTEHDIREMFGDRVARGVAALSKDKFKTYCDKASEIEDILARVIDAAETGAPYIKVADRIDNLRTAVYRHKLGKRLQPIEEAERYFRSFTDRYAPELKDELTQAVAHATFSVRHTELYHNGFRHTLRAAVLDLHETLGALAILSKLDGPAVSLDSYVDYLKKVWGLLQPIESLILSTPAALAGLELIQPIRMKTQLIQSDLRILGFSQAEIDALPRVKNLPSVQSLATMLGVLYTIEGSLLGGIAVRANVEPSLGLDAATGTAFLNTYGDVASTTAQFQAFMDSLEEIATSASDPIRFQKEVIGSAVDMFVLAHNWYS